MKCRAEAVRRDRQTLTVTRIYGVKCLEAIQAQAALLILGAYPWFRRPGTKNAEESDRMRQFFDGEARAVTVEINDNAPDRIFIHDRRLGRHEADRDERFEEVANDAEYALTRKLKDAGIDAEALWARAEAYMPERLFLGSDAIHRDARVAWYAWLGRRAVRMWIAAACLSLLDFEFASGRRRFSVASVERDFAVPLADFAAGWLSRFFAGRDREDRREQEARLRRLREEYNIDLRPVDPDNENTAQVKRLPQSDGCAAAKPDSPKASPEGEYERILAEVQRGRGVGIFPGGGK